MIHKSYTIHDENNNWSESHVPNHTWRWHIQETVTSPWTLNLVVRDSPLVCCLFVNQSNPILLLQMATPMTSVTRISSNKYASTTLPTNSCRCHVKMSSRRVVPTVSFKFLKSLGFEKPSWLPNFGNSGNKDTSKVCQLICGLTKLILSARSALYYPVYFKLNYLTVLLCHWFDSIPSMTVFPFYYFVFHFFLNSTSSKLNTKICILQDKNDVLSWARSAVPQTELAPATAPDGLEIATFAGKNLASFSPVFRQLCVMRVLENTSAIHMQEHSRFQLLDWV